MTQNIYDDEAFFEGTVACPARSKASTPRRSGSRSVPCSPGSAAAGCWISGAGSGWFCRWARERGAASVLGVDVSERMLARAKAETHDAAISYVRADLERFAIPRGAFDLAYSALALHYVENLEALLAGVHSGLVPGGRLVFSVEHPIFTAPANPGWSVDAAGHATWPVDRYLDEGPRSTDWLARGVIKQHRTIGTYVNLLIRTGFAISHLDEWGPSEEQVASRPDWARERQRPPFLLVACSR